MAAPVTIMPKNEILESLPQSVIDKLTEEEKLQVCDSLCKLMNTVLERTYHIKNAKKS